MADCVIRIRSFLSGSNKLFLLVHFDKNVLESFNIIKTKKLVSVLLFWCINMVLLLNY